MKYFKIRYLILTVAIAVIGVACSDSGSTGPGAETAAIEGKVEGDNSQQNKASTSQAVASVEGATVTAARVTGDGSLEAISNAETTTNAEGKFTLNVDAEAVANSSQEIIVMAEKDDQQWKAFVTGNIESGSTVKVQPLTVESSGEADVHTQIVAQGKSDIVSNADIEAYIDANASAYIRSNAEAAATFAEALAAEAEARGKFYAENSVEFTEEQKQDLMTAKAQAQAELESNLDAAESVEDKKAATEAFLEAIVKANIDAGVNAAAYAEAKELSGRVLLKNCASVSSEAKTDVRYHSALITSYALEAAIQARMEAVGAADQSLQAASQAAVTLRSDIKAASSATEAEIEAAYETYNQAIVDILKQEFSADTEVISSINAEINSTGNAKATFEAAVEATASTDVIVQAYSTFSSAVKSIVDTTFSSANDTEAKFVADVMVLINLAH